MPEFKKDYRKGKGRDFSSRGNGPRPQMHKAVCDTCGKECVVPFVPSGSKPVLCSNCYEKTQNRGESRFNSSDTRRSFSGQNTRSLPNDQLNAINTKLDKILALLTTKEPQEETQENTPDASE